MSQSEDFWAPRVCFTPRFPELEFAVDQLAAAADAIMVSDVVLARARLRQADAPMLRDVALKAMGPLDRGFHRLREVPMPQKAEKTDLRMPSKAVADSIFARDGWRCRFCGVRVVLPAARKALSAAVPDAVCWEGPAVALHAAFGYVSATLDHIVPHSRGGTNESDNLVTTCWPCNFGRGGYLLEQMGLTDPRSRRPVRDAWDGLGRLLNRPAPVQSRPAGAPSPTTATRSRPSRASRMSAPEWLGQVDGIGDDISDRMLAFLASCEGLPVSWSARDVLLLKMTIGERTLDVLGFERSGTVQIPWAIGDAKTAFRGFAEAVAAVIPGAVAYETQKMWRVGRGGKQLLRVEEILDAGKAIRDALARLETELASLRQSE
jgi:5-methylcytosine-specific restriction endonuclease McrA